MTGDRRSFIGTALAAGLAAPKAMAQPGAEGHSLLAGTMPPQDIIDLWPKGALPPPAAQLTETIVERSKDTGIPDRAIYGISRPCMAVFRPIRPNGGAVLITPGGGYRWVVIDKEGYEMGRWLALRGFTAFVLFYRLPGEGWSAGADAPLADAQRAMRLIRSRAGAFGVAEDRIAAIGFSAGGHVCADIAARFAAPIYRHVDAADLLPARPVCAAPLYPVVSMDSAIAHAGSRLQLLGPSPTAEAEARHSPDQNIPHNSPPHFLLHAEDDDSVPIENSLRLRAALKAKGVRVEAHLFDQGGHGFGLRKAEGKPVSAWPDLWRAWARTTPLG